VKNHVIMIVQNSLSSYTTLGRHLGGLFIYKRKCFFTENIEKLINEGKKGS